MTQFAKAIDGVTGSLGGPFLCTSGQLHAHSQTRLPPLNTFSARESFQEGNTIGGRILHAVAWNFTDHFLGMVENNVPEATVKSWMLLRPAGDQSLIPALGGEEQARMLYLCNVYRLMKMGGDGPCHVDWQSNFAYVRSPVDRRLWAVHWSVNYENEWTIGAATVPHPFADWPTGALVFNCQPS